ncbi:MAG: VirB8/TrbF family protein [Rhodothermales bacterium]
MDLLKRIKLPGRGRARSEHTGIDADGSVTNGRAPTSGHPYLQGRYEFEQVFGDLARRRRTWQIVAMLALILSLVLGVGFAGLARTQRIVPYVVELDRLGETRSVGKLALEEIPERAMIAALRRFIHNARTIPTDARLLNARLNEARTYAMGQALDAFVTAVREESLAMEQMLKRGDARYVEEISSILSVPGSPNSYRVTWKERTDSQEGNEVNAYEGYFTLRIVPPGTEEEILANPFGIYVVDYTWSRLNSIPAPEE